jgi:60 kDa SS-A/Ro ribonucleoprotein
MANKNTFRTKGASVAVTDTKNKAGGRAYSFGDEHALAQGIVTSTFNKTFYMTEAEQLDSILGLAMVCDPTFVAKAAVYGHEVAKMKDTPALMLAVLAARGKITPGTVPDEETRQCAELFARIAPRILTRFKMVQNFVQMVRSGKVGHRSFGSAAKRQLRLWLEGRTANQLFTGSIGSDPSFADVVKMVHPRPDSAEKKALYAYFIGREYDFEQLPPRVKEYELFKKALLGSGSYEGPTPSVPFQMLASLPLSEAHWKEIALNAPWNMLRMNLNTFERHGVLKDQKVVDELARKLADPDEVRRNNAFPYQLLTSFQNVNATIPAKLRNALQDAMETATENVPRFDGGVAVCIDTSGSMQSSATGYRQGATSKTRCVDVAALVGASIARKNDDTTLVPFDTRVHATHTLNVRDSIMTNAQKLANFGGGGTDVASAMRLLNTLVGNRPKTVIFVSDNESWYNEGGNGLYYRGSGLAHEWAAYKKKVPGAKLICIDVVANRTTQVVDSGDVMNIGGFSDKVWPLIERFVKEGNTDFVKLINETVSLESPTVVLEEPISEADGE